MDLHFSEEQENAILLGLDKKNKLVGITGPAGTGKTTIIGQILEQGDWKMPVLCAPTGRAAKRIQEATGINAMTIHRMMRYSMPADDDEAGLPAYGKWNKLPYDCILLDEASMLGEDIYRAVIDAMDSKCVIRFFGDANQLPPINSISPFVKLLEKFPSIRLSKNFRSGDGIVAAATMIVEGRVPEANDKFRMLNPGNGNIMAAVDKFIDDGFRGMTGQMIIPTKVGKFGTFNMNRMLQQRLNPKGPSITYKVDEDELRTLRVGDKIIQTKNDYKLNLYNGMIGWVSEVEDDEFIIAMDDRDIRIPAHMESYDPSTGRALFPYDPRKNIDLAYAITTHKAQGSEFDRVLLLMQRSYVLNRSNFYTAVTRAKDSCTAIFGPGGLAAAMKK